MAIEFGSRKENFDNFKVYETTLAGGNIREKITHLMDMRLSDYLDAAEVIIDTDGRSFNEMYENILKEKREA